MRWKPEDTECRKCGRLVSRKPRNRWNSKQRRDGGWDHVHCDPEEALQAKRADQALDAEELKGHHRAVQVAILRGDRL